MRQDAAIALGFSSASSEPDGSNFKIDGRTPTELELSQIDAKSAEMQASADSLESKKLIKHEEVRKKTIKIMQDATFTHGGKEFRLNDASLIRWVGVSHADMKDVIAFPYTVRAKDFQSHLILNKTELGNFFNAGLGKAEYLEGQGGSIHEAINLAPNLTALDLIVDNR